MPNYMKNRIRTQQSDWETLLNALINKDGDVDFNKVTPMPDSVYQGNLSGDRYAIPDGYTETWYAWCKRKWGTKWNAAYTKIDHANHEISFETAWNHPFPVLHTLGEKTGIPLYVLYADEDDGYNMGGYILNQHRYWAELPKEGSPEAINLTYLIRSGRSAKDWYQDGGYRYTDVHGKHPALEETYDPWERYGLNPPDTEREQA